MNNAVTNALNRVKHKLTDNMNRLIVTLAFLGCVNAVPAKTVLGGVIEVDGTTTYLLTSEGKMKIESKGLVGAITQAHNQKGGDLLVKLNFNENTSDVTGGWVYHSRIRVTEGMRGAASDMQGIADDAEELWNNIKNGNIRRTLNKGVDIVSNIVPIEIPAGGKVRILAKNAEGQQGYAQYQTVGDDGNLKPEYDKTVSGRSPQSYTYNSTSTINANQLYNSTATNKKPSNNQIERTINANQLYNSTATNEKPSNNQIERAIGAYQLSKQYGVEK